MEKIISTNNMDKNTLKKQSKSQLINLLLQQNAEIKLLLQQNMKLQPKNDNIILPPLELRDDYKPVPSPRKNVKQMVQDYEDNIILPPLEFMDDHKPIPKPRTKIEQVAKALKGYTKSFEIGIKNNKDPLEQLQSTRKAIEHHIVSILTSMKGLQFVETLRVTFKKLENDEIDKIRNLCFNRVTPSVLNRKLEETDILRGPIKPHTSIAKLKPLLIT